MPAHDGAGKERRDGGGKKRAPKTCACFGAHLGSAGNVG
nr:MAG TPA: hypothetical protein [Caudoviricetes sp.]